MRTKCQPCPENVPSTGGHYHFYRKPKRDLNRKHEHVTNGSGMFSLVGKNRKRSYLLPGAGSRASRRKRKVILTCSIIIGLGAALLLSALLYWMNRLSP